MLTRTLSPYLCESHAHETTSLGHQTSPFITEEVSRSLWIQTRATYCKVRSLGSGAASARELVLIIINITAGPFLVGGPTWNKPVTHFIFTHIGLWCRGLGHEERQNRKEIKWIRLSIPRMLLPECMRVARRKELQDERERKVETIRRTSRQVIWGKGVVRRWRNKGGFGLLLENQHHIWWERAVALQYKFQRFNIEMQSLHANETCSWTWATWVSTKASAIKIWLLCDYNKVALKSRCQPAWSQCPHNRTQQKEKRENLEAEKMSVDERCW